MKTFINWTILRSFSSAVTTATTKAQIHSFNTYIHSNTFTLVSLRNQPPRPTQPFIL